MKGTAVLSLALAVTVSTPAAAAASNVPPPAPASTAASTSTSTTGSSALVEPPPDPTSPIASVSTEPPSAADSSGSHPSLAEQARRKCRPRSFFRFHSFRPRNFFVPRTRFIDGPGGTMAASVVRQHRVYAEMEIEREKVSEIETGKLIRQLRNDVNPLLADEHIVETGHEYTREISDGMYGNLWYRVFGYRVSFTAWRQVYNCRVRKVTAGIANIPARVEGWRYWETRHPMFGGRRLSDR